MSDIIIIGGGIAGISAAARLAPHANVTVLEGETALAYHASGRSAAMFEASYGLDTTIALNLASADYHHTANGGYLTPRGMLFVARAHERDTFERELITMKLDEISPLDARAMVPVLSHDTVASAGYHHDAYDLDTDRMIQDFAKTLRANGGATHTNARVTDIAYANGKWHVTTNTETYTGDILINAGGAWVDEIAKLAGVSPLGFSPYRRSMARIPAPGDHDISNWPMFFGTGERWYAKPDAGQLIVSPADEDSMPPQDAWADDMVLAEGLARYEEMVDTPVTRMTSNWAGLRTFSPDRGLTLGRSSDHPAFFWCAGQGGYGFQTAPAASQLIADLVLSRAPELDDDLVQSLSPTRFA